MRHHIIGALAALQFVLSCGSLLAQSEGSQPAPPPALPTAGAPAAQAHEAASSGSATTTAARRQKPAEDLSLILLRRVVTAPGYLRSVMRVAPSSENRVLRVEIDSEDFFRSSEIQLDGADAPLSHFIDWKQVPAGTYELRATLIGPAGTRAERQTSFRVLGPILAQRCC